MWQIRILHSFLLCLYMCVCQFCVGRMSRWLDPLFVLSFFVGYVFCCIFLCFCRFLPKEENSCFMVWRKIETERWSHENGDRSSWVAVRGSNLTSKMEIVGSTVVARRFLSTKRRHGGPKWRSSFATVNRRFLSSFATKMTAHMSGSPFRSLSCPKQVFTLFGRDFKLVCHY